VKLWLRFPATPSSDATRTQRRRSLLLAVIGIAVLPLAWRGTSCGQDFDFHLEGWLDVVDHWHHGILYPHWASAANYLAGEPRFVFYPPLSWILGALLGVVLPWTWTPLAFTLIALLGAGFSFRAMAREWMPLDLATIAACLYVLNPYMLFVAYERDAMAELLAATWMPLLVLYALREKPSFLPLSVTIAALWLTNAPAAVMGCYMLVILVLIASLREKTWRLAACATCALALGLALAGFWLIPAVYQQRWVEIDRAIGPLMHVEDSFLFAYASTTHVAPEDMFDVVYHNQVLRTASWIGVALIVATALAAWLAFARSRVPHPGRAESREVVPQTSQVRASRVGSLWTPLVVIAVIVTALQFRFTDLLWRIAPKLQYLQFPWRWMMVLGLVFAALAGLAIRHEQTTRRAIAARGLTMLLLAGAMAVLSSLLFWLPCDDEDNITAQITTFHTKGFEGTDEYTPQPADNSQIPQSLPAVRLLRTPNAEAATSAGENPPWSPDNAQEIPATITIHRWTPEHIDASIAATIPGYAVLRLMDYPAWRITLNGAELRDHAHRNDGLLVIPVAAGSNAIAIRWRITSDQSAGIALSLAALAVTLIFGWKERRSRSANSIN
jgi:hypothetical protein